MSYTSIENSVHSGAPVELYRFALGANLWRYTSAREPITYDGANYASAALRRGGIEQTKEYSRAGLTLEAPEDLAVVQQFVVTAPDGALSLTVFRLHTGDGEAIVWWKGRVVSITFAGGVAQLRCEPVFTTLARSGVRANYQINCRHALYGAGCGADAVAFKRSGTLATVAGTLVTADALLGYDAGWFTGGRLVTGTAQRLIVASSGGSATLSAPIPGLLAGAAFDAYAGCDHRLATCAGKFSNHLNYGGFPWIPLKNPFAGDAIV